MRPSWDEYFMLMAKLVSTRSTCLKKKVGAVVVKDRRILATGYNGQLPGQVHCGEKNECLDLDCKDCPVIDNCPNAEYLECYKDKKGNHRYCRAVHAEANAILQAAKMGIPLEGAVLYCTLKPCPDCIKLIALSGIKKVFYETDYYHNEQKKKLWYFWKDQTDIEFIELKVSDNNLTLVYEVLGGKMKRTKEKKQGKRWKKWKGE